MELKARCKERFEPVVQAIRQLQKGMLQSMIWAGGGGGRAGGGGGGRFG